jgi:SpoVK/Ycf46/Vps4 family AAA+-type ATPase
MTPAYTSNIEHLQGALRVLNLRLHRQVLIWRADHQPGATPDELVGLYTSDASIDHLINRFYPQHPSPSVQAARELLDRLIEQQTDTHAARQSAALAAGIDLRLPRLEQLLGLSPFEHQVLLLGLAAEIDHRYERLFGYLNDDLTRRLPSVGLAAALFCEDGEQRLQAPLSFTGQARLLAFQLIHLHGEGEGLSLLRRDFRLDEPIAAFLLGASPVDPAIETLVQVKEALPKLPVVNDPAAQPLRQMAQVLASYPSSPLLVNLCGKDPVLLERAAAYLAAALAGRLLLVDGKELAARAPAGLTTHAARLARYSLLAEAVLAIHAPEGQLSPRFLQGLAAQPQPCLLLTESAWQPQANLEQPLLRLHIPNPDTTARHQLWQAELAGAALDESVDLLELADRFSLSAGQISACAAELRVRAAGLSRLSQEHLQTTCREGIRRDMGGLAQLVESRHTWDDLILKGEAKVHLLTLEHWARCRHTVLEAWGFGRKTAAHAGLVALFSGPSGTGKTLAAGILGRRLGLDVYRIDLSAIVSKYIGETEKNLERIFEMAQAANAILFFDEADALFGKRSQVKDAHDRYANVEVSYLLQRIEVFPGLAILASNLKQNLDSAFLRRLHMTIEFPFPQVNERRLLWRALIPPEAPLSPDIDFDFLAQQFSLAGGNIRNCVLYAAFSAAGAGETIAMRHLIGAVARELEKLEQPVLPSEFGSYFEFTRAARQGQKPVGRRNGNGAAPA